MASTPNGIIDGSIGQFLLRREQLQLKIDLCTVEMNGNDARRPTTKTKRADWSTV